MILVPIRCTVLGKNLVFFAKKSQILRIVGFRTITLVCIIQISQNFDMLLESMRLRSLMILVPIRCTVLGKTWFFAKKSQILRIVGFRTITLVCLIKISPNFDTLLESMRHRSLLILVPILCTVLGKNLFFLTKITDFENCCFPQMYFTFSYINWLMPPDQLG